MKLSCCTQVNPEVILGKQYDILICACGYEARSTHFARTHIGTVEHKIAFAFGDRKELSRSKNEEMFTQLGYKIEDIVNGDYSYISQYLLGLCKLINKTNLVIAVDYSCMTKTMYASIINFFRYSDTLICNANIDFVYSIAKYYSHYEAEANVVVGPIPGFTSVMPPNAPTALIIGLGCEKGRASSLMEYIDPAITYLCYSDPVKEPRYLEDIFKANSEILAQTSPDKIFTYPISDFVTASLTLSSLIVPLKGSHRTILAPLGPKPFSLACLIQAVVNPEIDVWRISGGVSSTPIDVEAAGEFVTCFLGFEEDGLC